MTLDDVVLEGTETFTVNLDATNTLVTDSDTATGTITDDEVAGVTVVETEDSTMIAESGTTDTIEVTLTAQPLTDVVLAITSADTGEATVDQGTLTFMPTNWDVPQTVTITGVRDLVDDGDQQTTIEVSVNPVLSNDAFDLMPSQSVVATTVDEPVDQLSVTASGVALIVSDTITGDVLIEQLLEGLETFTIVTGDRDKTIDVDRLTDVGVTLVIHSGVGDDTVTLADIASQQILAGPGYDTLRLSSEQNHLDLSATDDSQLNGIEEIDITGSGDNTLTLDVNEVLNISDTSDDLFVLSDLGDTVNIAAGWTLTGTQFTGGTFFRVLEQSGARLFLNGPANWQNPVNRLDVNNDGLVTPVGDILPLINEANQRRIISSTGVLPEQPVEPNFPAPYFDVNGDGNLTPVGDILVQINFINSQSDQEGESRFALVDTALPVEILVASVIHGRDAAPDGNPSRDAVPSESLIDADTQSVPYFMIRIDFSPQRVPEHAVIDRLVAADLEDLLSIESDLESLLDDLFGAFE